MRVKKTRLKVPHFELCSLALFAALGFAAAPQARAQAVFGPTGGAPARVAPVAAALKSGSPGVAPQSSGTVRAQDIVKPKVIPLDQVRHTMSNGVAGGAAPSGIVGPNKR
jgi:hypothetical protein